MPKLPQKIMNNEISKYQGRIYFFEERKDRCGNLLSPNIVPAPWVSSTKDYSHYELDLHHIIKFSSYESNKDWYISRGLEMCLILLPKVLHQHLEYDMYALPDAMFFEKYKIHRYELLFNKNDYNNGNFPKMLLKKTETELFYDGCFDCLDEVASNV